MFEERGIKSNYQEMVMRGKDLKAIGAKSEKDGETMVGHEKSMMGEMEGMGH